MAVSKPSGKPVDPMNHLIDGAWRPVSDGGRLDVISPLNGEVLTTMASGTRDDAEAAVAAARQAFDDGRWADLAPAARKAVMLRWRRRPHRASRRRDAIRQRARQAASCLRQIPRSQNGVDKALNGVSGPEDRSV